MSRTRKIDLTPESWVLVSQNSSFCVIQLQSNGPVRVHISPSVPEQNAPGIMLVSGELREISFFDLDPSDQVYAHTKDSGEFLICIDNGS